MTTFTPREIVSELDRFIVGQNTAKRAVAIALRNRWRRQQIKGSLKEEVLPKNILMIGPTGVGKTEIARRLAKLADAPFIKVEATKFTEVGYVGRDVEQIIRDLLEVSINNNKESLKKAVKARAEISAEKRVIEALVGSSASSQTKEKFKTPEISFSDELINITDLRYPEFNKPDSLENNLPYQDLFQDISISRIITQSNLQEENTDDDVRMSENQVFFQNDSGADFAMEEIVQTLKRSKNYRVIDQNSWFQEIKDQSQAPAVLIKTKIDDGDIVVGEIKAYKKRFLHLDANLYFAKESIDPASFEKIVILKEQFKKGEFVINQINLFENEELEFLYQINHSRKLRSKELHYIDHPKFGVIFQISPTKNI